MPPKSTQQRENERRQEKLGEIRKQVDEGSLVIRKMTDADRRKLAAATDRRRTKR